VPGSNERRVAKKEHRCEECRRLCREAIAEAARDPHVGEAPVRDAIRSALSSWALGGST
jgi:hypothetical protein